MFIYLFCRILIVISFFAQVECEESWYTYDIYQRMVKLVNYEIYSPSNHPFRLWKIREISPYLTNLIHQAKIPLQVKARLSQRNYSHNIGNNIPNATNLTSYNSMENYQNCFSNVRNQGKCKANWAFTLANSLSTSFCIKKNNSNYVELSPQKLISCGHGSGCNDSLDILGNLLMYYLKFNGITEENCDPYSASEAIYIESCVENKCKVKSTEILTYKANVTFIIVKESLSNVKNTLIKENIIRYGSIVGVFSYFEDFIYYKSGIYKSIEKAEKMGVIYLKVSYYLK